jgi:hypothetical protein
LKHDEMKAAIEYPTNNGQEKMLWTTGKEPQ